MVSVSAGCTLLELVGSAANAVQYAGSLAGGTRTGVYIDTRPRCRAHLYSVHCGTSDNGAVPLLGFLDIGTFFSLRLPRSSPKVNLHHFCCLQLLDESEYAGYGRRNYRHRESH